MKLRHTALPHVILLSSLPQYVLCLSAGLIGWLAGSGADPRTLRIAAAIALAGGMIGAVLARIIYRSDLTHMRQMGESQNRQIAALDSALASLNRTLDIYRRSS